MNNNLEITGIQVFQQEYQREKFIRLMIKNNGGYEKIHDTLQVVDNVLFVADQVHLPSGECKSLDVMIYDLNMMADNGEVSQWAEDDSGIKALYDLTISKHERNIILKTYNDDITVNLNGFNNVVGEIMKKWEYVN